MRDIVLRYILLSEYSNNILTRVLTSGIIWIVNYRIRYVDEIRVRYPTSRERVSMIWFIIFGVIGIVIATIITVSEGDGFFEWLSLSVVAIIAGALVAVLIGIGVSTIASACGAATELVRTDAVEIQALKDNSQISGRFFLGSGRVDEEMHYFYIEETSHGKHMDNVPAKYTHVIESNNERPRVEKYIERYRNVALRWLTVTFFEPLYKIYVPEGSITTEFNVDLEDSNSAAGTGDNSGTSTTEFCGGCGKPVADDNAKFCTGCGFEFIKENLCTKCGHSVEDNDEFCGSCGMKVKE